MGKRRKLISQEGNSQWPDLPYDLLHLIASRLNFFDVIRLRAVLPFPWCPSVQPTPLLMIPPQEKKDTKTNTICFWDIGHDERLEINNFTAKMKNSLCIGSSHGWLIFTNQKGDPYLVNPFYLQQIDLPGIETIPEVTNVSIFLTRSICFPGIAHRHSVQKAILSADPSSPDDNFMVAIIYKNGSKLAVYRNIKHNADGWISLEGDNKLYHDIVFSGDLLYALGSGASVEIWDSIWGFPTKKMTIFPTNMFYPRYNYLGCYATPRRYYLVVTDDGDILLVDRIIEGTEVRTRFSEKTHKYKTMYFNVYKLDLDKNVWLTREDYSLGDRALFLGGNHSKCVHAKDLGHYYKANSIYFTDDYWDETMHDSSYYGGYDLGVFDYKDKRIEPLPCVQKKRVFRPQPFWIIIH